jgi:hypothetical protein
MVKLQNRRKKGKLVPDNFHETKVYNNHYCTNKLVDPCRLNGLELCVVRGDIHVLE